GHGGEFVARFARHSLSIAVHQERPKKQGRSRFQIIPLAQRTDAPVNPKGGHSRGHKTEAAPLVRFQGTVLLTEKVDGVNTRIVCLPDGTFLLGSREEWLYARGDLLHNPAMGIVEATRPIAERIYSRVCRPDAILVYYGEVFGGKLTDGSRQYTGEGRVG